jgi:hypothetical protein
MEDDFTEHTDQMVLSLGFVSDVPGSSLGKIIGYPE